MVSVQGFVTGGLEAGTVAEVVSITEIQHPSDTITVLRGMLIGTRPQTVIDDTAGRRFYFFGVWGCLRGRVLLLLLRCGQVDGMLDEWLRRLCNLEIDFFSLKFKEAIVFTSGCFRLLSNG